MVCRLSHEGDKQGLGTALGLSNNSQTHDSGIRIPPKTSTKLVVTCGRRYHTSYDNHRLKKFDLQEGVTLTLSPPQAFEQVLLDRRLRRQEGSNPGETQGDVP